LSEIKIMANEKILETVKDAVAVASALVESAKTEVLWILPSAVLGLGAQFGLNEMAKKLIEKGGRVRGIVDHAGSRLDLVPEHLNNGEEVRLLDPYQGTFMLVADSRESISAMTVSADQLALDDPIVVFWTDNKVYAEFLSSTFEAAWNRAVEAKTLL